MTDMESLTARAEAAEREGDELKRQLAIQQSNNHDRNIALDALHYVWCDGGCSGGIHRFGDHPALTQEIVESAVRNTSRLIGWFVNRAHKQNGHKTPDWCKRYMYFCNAEMVQFLEQQVSEMREPLEIIVNMWIKRADPQSSWEQGYKDGLYAASRLALAALPTAPEPIK